MTEKRATGKALRTARISSYGLAALSAVIVGGLALVAVPWGAVGWAAVVAVSVGLVVLVITKSHHSVLQQLRANLKVERELQWRHFQQTEALMSVMASIPLSFPLPPTRGFAASPDFLRRVLSEVLLTRPRLVVEASSGVSTVIIASALKQLGGGRVISLEHEHRYAEQTRAMLSAHGLQSIATVVDAPLTSVALDAAATLPSRTWQWYDVSRADLNCPIDLLVIDGPPMTTQPLARYPALPILWDRLRPGATVILDDGSRPDERAAVDAWLAQFAGLEREFVDLEKGAYLLRKPPVPDATQA
jgi:predicted O-methyltransferase YrrM